MNYDCKTLFLFAFAATEELDEFIAAVIHAYKRGVVAIGNSTMEPNWSFGQSLFFAATVITTIGKDLVIILNFVI